MGAVADRQQSLADLARAPRAPARSRVPPRRRGLVRRAVPRRPDRAAAARVAGDRDGPRRARRLAHRVRQDAHGVPRRDRRRVARPRRGRAVARRAARRLRLARCGPSPPTCTENLDAPLEGITAAARALGLEGPSLRVGLRTGDSTPRRARGAAQAPARPARDDARVALPAAHVGVGPRDVRAHRDRHRRRDPRGVPRQARQPPRAQPRAARPARRRRGAARSSASGCRRRSARSRRWPRC